MNILWYLVRFFYVLGLLPVVPLFLIFVSIGKKDPDVSVPVIVFSIGYFVGGWVILKIIPDILRSRLKARVASFKADGFTPAWEIEAAIFNRYIGFDPKARKLLYVDVNDGTERLVDYDEVSDWEFEVQKSRPAIVKFLTCMPDLPVISLTFDRRRVDECRARIGTVLA